MASSRHDRWGGGKSAYVATLNTPGDNSVITPSASDKFIRVFWVAFVPNSDNASANLVTVKFESGPTLYKGYALAHWELFDGARGKSVIVNLQTAEPVAVTLHYVEV